VSGEGPSEAGLLQALRVVAAWLAAQNFRAHVEWVTYSGRLYVVQMDHELSPEKMPPMSELQQPLQPAPIPTSWDPAIFRPLDAEHDFSDLRKTRSHCLLQGAGAFVPPIYVAREIGTEAQDPESALWRDLYHLLANPTIIRFDVPLHRTE
jgi:hypothetical protein